MKLTFLLLFLVVPIKMFSQDPNCELIVTLKEIDEHKYAYKLLVEFDYEKSPIDSIKIGLESVWNGWQGIQSAILKTDSNKKILVGYISDYCYPRQDNTDQLRIIVARKRKRDNKIELMHSSSNLIAQTRTEIIIEKFKAGQKKTEIFEYERDYIEHEGNIKSYNQGLNLNKRMIYLK